MYLPVPVNGYAYLWKRGVEDPEIAQYHIEGDEHMAITIGWEHFAEDYNIVEGSLLLMIAEPRTHAILVDFVEILDP